MIDTAFVLAAGLGTRLAPLSYVRAKAALPVGEEPLIRQQVRWLAASGVLHVVVNLHHLPATITSQLGHGDDLGVAVRYSWEPDVLGSAGGPRRAFELTAAQRAFIVNGDMLTNVDLRALAEAHLSHRPQVTMATIDPRPGYNALLSDAPGTLVGVTPWRGVVTEPCRHLSHGHFIGVQVAERSAFAAAPANEPSDTMKWLYPRLLAADATSVRVWHSDASYHDIGSLADYRRTALAMSATEAGRSATGRDVNVHPSATVETSVLWDRVTVGPGAGVHGCVLADDVVVPEGMRLQHVAVVPRARAVPDAPGRADGGLWLTPINVTTG